MTYNELECKYHLALRQIKKQGNEIEALSKKKLELEKKSSPSPMTHLARHQSRTKSL